jgi:hypothetical protein
MLDFLQFPESLFLKQKLTKKSFYDMGNLSNAQQKLLQEQVESIQLSFHLTPDKTNISSYVSSTHEYLEILVIEVKLKTPLQSSEKQLSALHEIFHKAIPYPVILLLNDKQSVQLSLADKTINQSDISNNKLVMNVLTKTNWINSDLTEIQQTFLESISYNNLNKQNLYQFYQSLTEKVIAYLLALETGTYLNTNDPEEKLTLDQQRQKLKNLIQLETEITELKNKIATSSQFNEKVELNLQLQTLKTQLEQLKKA